MIARAGGFSFIEVIVVMAMIGVVAVFCLPTFIGFMQAQRTKSAARELVAMLNQARHLAVTRNTAFSIEVRATPRGSQLRYCSGMTTPCPGANVWAGPGTGANGWMGMANGDRIVFSPQITFSSLGAASSAGTLRVQNAEGSSCLDVVVSPAGRIRIALAGACP